VTPDERNALWLRAVPLVKKTVGRFVASGVLPSYLATEDLLQDLLLGVSKSIDSYDPDKGAYSTWIVARTRGGILNHLRTNRKTKALQFDCDQLTDERMTSIVDRLEQNQIKAAVREAISKLPLHHQVMLSRAFGIGTNQMLLKEIAAEDGKTISVIQKDIMRALKKLQSILPSI
jgi:RNA polymerase sigma factor (sigma-70 family)